MVQIKDLDGIYVFRTGKHTDFVIFNPLHITLTNQAPKFEQISLTKNEFWNEIKSITWSVNCRFYFVISEDSIIIGNCYTDNALRCNQTIKLFDEFLKYYEGE